jgi:hypothetical protein
MSRKLTISTGIILKNTPRLFIMFLLTAYKTRMIIIVKFAAVDFNGCAAKLFSPFKMGFIQQLAMAFSMVNRNINKGVVPR